MGDYKGMLFVIIPLVWIVLHWWPEGALSTAGQRHPGPARLMGRFRRIRVFRV